jgi:hypothetical protein
MLKKLGAVLLMVSAFAVNAEGTMFKKDNALLEMSMDRDTIKFRLNASVDQSACEAEGTAKIIDDHRAAYTPDDTSDLCVILFNFESTDRVKVTTKDCGGYCGLGAKGSMDGAYSKR